ncbi:MAG: hypothetical protein JWL59_5009 [Chthoniobacteraceae bacterium]|nr:hypothetical protein [Chthoniobacteraceae bacterium]
MSRRTLSLFPLLAVLVAVSGCGTIYSDVYGPKRNHFVPPPSRPSIPIIPTPPAPGDTTPSDPSGSSSPRVHAPAPVVMPPPLAPMQAEPLPGM